MFGIGLPEIIIIAVVALVFIGPDKLPGVLRSIGKGLVELKRATSDVRSTLQEEIQKIEPKLDSKVLEVFNLKSSINSKKSYGGTSFENIKKMIRKYKNV